MAIRILTDSGADYTAQEIETRQITLIPMTVTIGNEQYRDGIDITKEEFFDLLETTKDLPKTSQPSPTVFIDEFESAKEAGDSIIVILIASVLSGTYQNANLAKNMVGYEDVHIIDSTLATLCMRILVDRAVKMRDAGNSALEIVAELEALKNRIRLYASLDTLDYLAKGGRLSGSAAAIGNLAKVKPVISLDEEGHVFQASKQLGIRHACKYISKQVMAEDIDEKAPLYFIYSKDTKNVNSLIHTMEKDGFPIENPKVRGIGPIIGTHIGPCAFGIVYVVK